MSVANLRLNEGTIDRTLRLLVGVAVLSLTVIGPKTSWGLVGLLPLITGAAGFCPLYRLVGLSSCPATRAR